MTIRLPMFPPPIAASSPCAPPGPGTSHPQTSCSGRHAAGSPVTSLLFGFAPSSCPPARSKPSSCGWCERPALSFVIEALMNPHACLVPAKLLFAVHKCTSRLGANGETIPALLHGSTAGADPH